MRESVNHLSYSNANSHLKMQRRREDCQNYRTGQCVIMKHHLNEVCDHMSKCIPAFVSGKQPKLPRKNCVEQA